MGPGWQAVLRLASSARRLLRCARYMAGLLGHTRIWLERLDSIRAARSDEKRLAIRSRRRESAGLDDDEGGMLRERGRRPSESAAYLAQQLLDSRAMSGKRIAASFHWARAAGSQKLCPATSQARPRRHPRVAPIHIRGYSKSSAVLEDLGLARCLRDTRHRTCAVTGGRGS